MSLAKPVNLAMRALQFFWALLVMALIGNIIHDATKGNPSIINYNMFVAVFGMLSLFYLVPATISERFVIMPILPLIIDVLNVLFWFCGAVALAAKLGVHSCSNHHYLQRNHVTNGAHNMHQRCQEAQASCAFLWFGFAAFVVSAVFSGLNMSGSGGVRPGGIRRHGPAMSQV